jgi:hypothetical protein
MPSFCSLISGREVVVVFLGQDVTVLTRSGHFGLMWGYTNNHDNGRLNNRWPLIQPVLFG